MKNLIAIAAGTLLLSVAATASASPASREFHRGYYDCLAGRFDQEQHGHAYREGCRAAEREREEDGSGGEGAEACPPYVSEADRDRYPGCQGMEEHRRRPPPDAPYLPGPAVPNVARPVGVPNVNGMEPPQVLASMASYGYRNVGTTVVGGAIFGIYFNPMTRECVQVANSNGRAINAVEIGSHPRCR